MVLWNVEGNINDKCTYYKNREWNLWVRSGGGRAEGCVKEEGPGVCVEEEGPKSCVEEEGPGGCVEEEGPGSCVEEEGPGSCV